MPVNASEKSLVMMPTISEECEKKEEEMEYLPIHEESNKAANSNITEEVKEEEERTETNESPKPEKEEEKGREEEIEGTKEKGQQQQQ